MNYRELLKQYLDGLGSKEIDVVAGLYLVGFAHWLETNAAQQSVQADGFWACAECDYQNVNALDICTHCFNRRR